MAKFQVTLSYRLLGQTRQSDTFGNILSAWLTILFTETVTPVLRKNTQYKNAVNVLLCCR